MSSSHVVTCLRGSAAAVPRTVQGKKRYYVQSDGEMKSQLLERGLADTVFEAEDGRRVEGEKMRELCTALGRDGGIDCRARTARF